ncbi:hypothetical protein ZEAMMB73_Zm00001d005758 [Zea mays]|uniref:Replication protein n=1 Tax=Zea mays TaxID=4577 RepID=A0A1D6EPY0_MAIZE|nr:hypothetical protein ZEAMMB73_Zm00001d005758 [Zea mays]ONM21830.1 hypothetical protein ZEAMMB73_Zm00001d005758 [Zea mays]
MVSSLLDMLNENNSLVKAFRCARERLEREGDQKITLRLLGCNTRHDVQYNLPSNGEIATIIVGDYTTGEYTYDVLVHDREYFGDDDVGSSKRKYVAMLEFMGDVLIPELQRGNTSVTICARVSRLWDLCDPQDEAKLLHCDMVLLDEEMPLELSLPSRPWRRTDPEGNIQPALRGLFPYAVSDGLCLSGGSPYKWYINPDVPEASALMASATKAHSPIKWNEVLSLNQPMSHVPEEQKIAYIRDLHPFENKDREFLVTVTVKKIGDRWWYNACKKCTRTAVAHGDSYKCSDQVCANIGTPNQSSTVVPGATPAITKELTSTPRKRTRSSPAKTVTKRLFTDVDGGIAGSKDAADSATAPSSTKDA